MAGNENYIFIIANERKSQATRSTEDYSIYEFILF